MNANLKFSELNLEPRLQSAIDKMGYTECTPIQTQVIPHVLAGKDISGLAQTGTGKTAAFLIPLMDRILKTGFQDFRPPNFILILVPTRELAEQVYENIQKLSEFSGLRGIAIYGGTGYEKQKEALKNNVEFVVATPGRLIDLYKEHFVDLKQVRAVVFDEADRMFDMGFKDDMKYILQRVPRERQFLVFSATMNFDVLNTAYQFGANPVEVNVSKDQAKAENVKDEIFHVGNEEKPSILLSILKKHNPRQVIVFSNFKFSVERIANFLTANGIPAMGISSLLSQSQRNRVIELFKAENEKNILVATDVAARGLDIQGVDMVINYELPNDAESYVHRIGRTGRAGAEGVAFSLVGDKDVESLSRIEDYLKHKLDVGWLEDSDIVKEFTPISTGDGFRRASSNMGTGEDSRTRSHRGGPHHRGPRREREYGRESGGERGAGPRREGRFEGRRQERRHESRHEGRHGDTHESKEGQQGHPQGERPTHKTAHSKPAHAKHRSGKPSQHGKQLQGERDSQSRHGQRPQHSSHKHGQAGHRHRNSNRAQGEHSAQTKSATNKKTTIQKVSGFFKKLFGG